MLRLLCNRSDLMGDVMNNKKTYYKIEQSITTICRANGPPDDFANGVASVFYDGIRIAEGWGFDWVDEDGYSDAYYEAAIKGMKHTLYAERREQDVREFFHQFFGTSKEL